MKVPVAVFALFSLILITGSRAEDEECENLVPGLVRMSKGVDLTKLDLYHNYADAAEDGFVRPVITYSCRRKRSFRLDNTTYQIPDQIETIEEMSSGTGTSASKLVKTRSELRHEMESQAGIGSSGSKGSFSASGTYKTAIEDLETSRKFLSVKTTMITVSKAQFEPSAVISESSMSQNLRTAINKLPDKFNRDTVKPYMLLFEVFGTHFFQTANFGGILSSVFQIDKSLRKEMTDKEIGFEVDAKFKELLSIKGKYETKDHKMDQRFEKATTSITRYNGGKAELLDKNNDYSGWSATVAAKPWILSGVLQPITRLLSDDEPKKAEIKKAYTTYMERAHLIELANVTMAHINSPDFGHQKTLIEIQEAIEDKLETDPIPDPAFSQEMEQRLTDHVVTPAWFKESEFCFRRDSVTGDNAARCLKVGDMGGYSRTVWLCDGWNKDEAWIPFWGMWAGYEVKCFPYELTIKPATEAGARILERSKVKFSFDMGSSWSDNIEIQKYIATMKVDDSPDAETPGWLRLVKLGVRVYNKEASEIEHMTASVNQPLTSWGAHVGGAGNVYWTKERSAWKAGLWYLVPSDDY